MNERVINLQFDSVCVITTEQYDAIKRDLEIRIMVDSAQPGDHILARLLIDTKHRYHEIKMLENVVD